MSDIQLICLIVYTVAFVKWSDTNENKMLLVQTVTCFYQWRVCYKAAKQP